jgi:hypothetical protein
MKDTASFAAADLAAIPSSGIQQRCELLRSEIASLDEDLAIEQGAYREAAGEAEVAQLSGDGAHIEWANSQLAATRETVAHNRERRLEAEASLTALCEILRSRHEAEQQAQREAAWAEAGPLARERERVIDELGYRFEAAERAWNKLHEVETQLAAALQRSGRGVAIGHLRGPRTDAGLLMLVPVVAPSLSLALHTPRHLRGHDPEKSWRQLYAHVRADGETGAIDEAA